MVTDVVDHTFNDDLLLRETDRALALKKYTSIFHVLDYPELRLFFLGYDAPANTAKRNSQWAGVFSIGSIPGAHYGNNRNPSEPI